ncbi:hypothetical protein L218DRAFT_1005899 [Marasmius fiardii PR-910]|nr:hypothetical protein L218DRAFT_1005899 [Marasmius fiardii PR-910]
MFYLIAAPGSNAIQRVPNHWNMANVTEYCRRRAQRTLLKDMKVIKNNQKPNQTFIYPPGAEDIGFKNLTVDSRKINGSSSNQDGTGSIPPYEDTVMSNSDGSSSSNP